MDIESAIKGALVAAIVVVLVLTFRRRGTVGHHFRVEGALASGDVTLGERFELALPAGPALDVMLRYTIDHNESVMNPGTSNRRNGFAVLVEVSREGADGAPAITERYERVFGGASTLGLAPVADAEPTYQVQRLHGRETGTKVLARLPAGGAGRIEVLVNNSITDVGTLTLFVKPAKA